MRIPVPCDGCTDRSVTCHATCEKYLAYKKQMDAEAELHHKRKSHQVELGSYKIQVICKKKRRKHKK